MRIAFVAVGRRVELVRSFRRALYALGIEGQLIGIDADPLAPALQVCDRTFIVPRLEDPRFLYELVAISAAERINLMFPLIDPMIEILADHRPLLEETGARVVVVSPEAARTAGDKFQLFEFFQGLGLATPQSWLPEDLDSHSTTYPLFIKPRRGSASQHTFKVHNYRELDFFAGYVPEPIVQEFVPGAEITSDVACDLAGKVLGVVSRQRIEVRSGEVSKGVTIYDSTIQEACVRIARALPAVGPITVQCLMQGEKPLFTEVNARLGGGIPLAIAAGLDIPALLIACTAGVDTSIPALGSYDAGLYMTRYDESYFIRGADLELKTSNDYASS